MKSPYINLSFNRLKPIRLDHPLFFITVSNLIKIFPQLNPERKENIGLYRMTIQMFKIKKATRLSPYKYPALLLTLPDKVGREGIEPPTQGFSVLFNK